MQFPVIKASISALILASSASAGLVSTQSDGALPVVYSNGGGSGFGGALGAGSFTFDVVGSNLVIGFNQGAGRGNGDYVGLFLDTVPGGYTDATIDDTSDGDHYVLTQLTRTQNDTFPITPDAGIVFRPTGDGGGGSEFFTYNGGTNSLSYVNSGSATTITIALSALGLTPGTVRNVDFFAALSSADGYNSNESLPGTTAGINQNGNPGFGDGQFGGLNTGGNYDNFNRFVVPEPATMSTLAAVGLVALRRRK